MDLGVFDAWAGLLISHPHHQLSAAPSVSQIIVCRRRHMARGRKVGVFRSVQQVRVWICVLKFAFVR